MKKYFFVMILAASFSANASDHWDTCSSSDGTVQMENGDLSIVGGIGPTTHNSLVVLHTIKSEQRKCRLAGSKVEVISYDNTITVEQVKYTMEESDAESSAYLICERGGSGVPAADTCED